MTPFLQTILAPPHGDCHRACVASILELDPSVVPNFVGEAQDPGHEDWLARMNAWTRQFGLGVVWVEVEDPSWRSPGYYVGSFETDRETRHCVVMKDDAVVWDPSPRPSQLKKFVGATLFVTLDPSKRSVV